MRYAYFDSEITGVDEEGMPIFDRAESSDMFAMIFSKLITNGVLAQPDNCFQVLAKSGSDLMVEVQPGFAVINGRFAYEREKTTLILDEAPSQYSRIDSIVIRCNYLKRLIEIVVKPGVVAPAPRRASIEQPESGDYFELLLAEVRVSANQKTISQSNIRDTRANSAVCGYVTQLIDHLDTSVFFAQLNQFYDDFETKSEDNFNDFRDKAQKSYDDFNAAIDDYAKVLKSRGDSDVAEITERLREFQRTQQDEFNDWLARIKEQLTGNTAGNLQLTTDDHEARLAELERMMLTNHFEAPIALDGSDVVLVDDNNDAINADWRYKEA